MSILLTIFEPIKNYPINPLKHITLLLAVILSITAFSQKESEKKNYIQPEYFIGKVLPNYADTFPKTGLQHGFSLNFGSQNTDTNSWARYYNYAESGVMLNYANFGNNEVFGHQFSINPYVSFPVFNKAQSDYHLKIGMGISYFTTHFDSTTNYTNNMIGSAFTWEFKLFLYRNLMATESFNLRMGFGFSHESNGHTVMPNMGINSALLSLSGQFYKKKNNLFETPKRIKGKNHSEKKLFIHVRKGIGWHGQNGSEGPKENRILPVYASSFGAGYIYNKHLKLRAGLTYKFYEQYRTHLTENNIEGLSENPNLSASAFVFYIGNEFLMSHVSMDVELGVNLHKPFYRHYHPSSKIAVVPMKLIATRLGVNLYLFNTNKLPKHNFFVGGTINANFGKADFTEFSLGYTCVFNKH